MNLKAKRRLRGLIETMVIVALAVWLSHCGSILRFYARHVPVWGARGLVQPRTESAALVVAGARAQIGTVYDADYVPIAYPGGDVPSERGACSDVVIRALRHAGVDLQPLIHEDILLAPAAYPGAEPDPNIDHRRCLNQTQFFSRHGLSLTTEVSSSTLGEWQPGDLVYWRQPGDGLHTGVLSNRVNAQSLPLVIHNSRVCLEQNCLTDWEITGHFRFPP